MRLGLVLLAVGAPVAAARPASPAGQLDRPTFHRLTSTVRPDHPEILPVVAAIRAVTTDPLEQLAMVQHVTRLLVEYDSDHQVYRRKDHHATLDEMIARRRQAGWTYLRDDCDGRAVFAAHLLASLGIPWRLEASYWKGHAWVSAVVGGVRYDLLDLEPADPELRHPSYRWVGRHVTRPSRPVPAFASRRAWRERTGADPRVGERLGLLERVEPGQPARERVAVNWTRRRGDAPEPTWRGDLAAPPGK
jgi:hypothetical protein